MDTYNLMQYMESDEHIRFLFYFSFQVMLLAPPRLLPLAFNGSNQNKNHLFLLPVSIHMEYCNCVIYNMDCMKLKPTCSTDEIEVSQQLSQKKM